MYVKQDVSARLAADTCNAKYLNKITTLQKTVTKNCASAKITCISSKKCFEEGESQFEHLL